ncbi:hypothetical protein J2S43_002414 [Catenuloplanes nepalensis]|uniref:Uncharacterized protein n=1 Tax=Catenuloplanes nepalensis TaxID=587533 RepID=A0ABT9MR44_9ACTN|nr:hypothetical protein [Catenuloplanes nepalensis]MDP9793902.1 hypothetical protein [Catenuloplanes nepalensis]
MHGPRHDEIVKSLVELLIAALPDGRDRIVATGEADLGHSTSSLTVVSPDGSVTPVASLPEFDLTLIKLYDDTVDADAEPWNTYTLTVQRDGAFTIALSYVSPEG